MHKQRAYPLAPLRRWRDAQVLDAERHLGSCELRHQAASRQLRGLQRRWLRLQEELRDWWPRRLASPSEASTAQTWQLATEQASTRHQQSGQLLRAVEVARERVAALALECDAARAALAALLAQRQATDAHHTRWVEAGQRQQESLRQDEVDDAAAGSRRAEVTE